MSTFTRESVDSVDIVIAGAHAWETGVVPALPGLGKSSVF